MSLLSLTKYIDALISEKVMLAETLRANLSFAKMEIHDVITACQLCGRSSTTVWYIEFDTLMGKLLLHFCDHCIHEQAEKARQEKQAREPCNECDLKQENKRLHKQIRELKERLEGIWHGDQELKQTASYASQQTKQPQETHHT